MEEQGDVLKFSAIWKISYIVSCLVVFAIVGNIFGAGRGVLAALSFAVMMLIIRTRWNLRSELWFLAVFAVMGAVHLIGTFLIPTEILPNPTIIIAPFAILDYLFMLGLTFFAEKLIIANRKTI